MFRRVSQGFALPTVVVTAVVLFGVLVAVMGTVSSARTALDSQYQQALARDAAESGIAYADFCFLKNAGTNDNTEWPVATSGDGKTLDTGDDCNGKPITGVNCAATNPNPVCYVTINDNIKSSYSIAKPVVSGTNYQFVAKATVGVYRSGAATASSTYASSLRYSGYISIDGVASGNDTTCAIQLSKLYCWGKNESGQVGMGSTTPTNVLSPVLIQGALAGKYVYDVATGVSHVCAVAGDSPTPDTTSKTYCWGNNSLYQYGMGNTAVSYVPTQAATIAGYYPVAVSARDHTCVIAVSNTDANIRKMYCWGDNANLEAGESGSASTLVTQNPKTTPGSPLRGAASTNDITSITAISSVHNTSTCGINGTNAFCIGTNGHGALGNDAALADSYSGASCFNTSSLCMARVAWVKNAATNSALTGVTKIVTNNGYACAIASGTMYCWGQNGDKTVPNVDYRIDSGPNFKDNTYNTMAKPLITTGSHLGKTVTDIAISDWNTCFIIAGTVYCSGYNDMGQLGRGSAGGPATGSNTTASLVRTANNAQPVQGALVGKEVTRIVGGNNHFCAVTKENGAYCWGWNAYGQLGDGTTVDRYSPTKVLVPAPTIF